YDGGYDDWLRQKAERSREPAGVRPSSEAPTSETSPSGRSAVSAPATTKSRKLSNKEQRELDSLPQRIEKLESRIAELHAQMADPAFYKSDGNTISTVQNELNDATQELETCYERWSQLE
ncbi:MAG: hypothetical protein KDA81_22200, partial [Planctomycetaceae bacterium]|nr:hypothetical protein [Planctomycetaceae bacterium]